MHEKELQTFVDGTIFYFEKLTHKPATVGVPSILADGEEKVLDLTAAIGVAGLVTGAIYITASKEFFKKVLSIINPEMEQSEVNIADVAGEIANTIAGNAQRAFGPEFRISIPLIINNKGGSSEIRIKEPRYNIPISWEGHKIYMIIGLTQ